MGILKFVCLRSHSVRNYNTSILTFRSLFNQHESASARWSIKFEGLLQQLLQWPAHMTRRSQIKSFAGPGCANHDSPSPDDVHNRTPQFLFLFEIQNSSKINFACMHLTWSPSYFLLDKRDMSISDYDLEWGAPCDTLCLNWSQAVCLLSVGGLAAGKQERRST